MPETADPIRVACCQLRPQFGDLDGNRALVRGAIRAAVAQGARLIVLPELCTTGYQFESRTEARALAQTANGGALDDWLEEAQRADVVIVGGFAELGEDGALYSSAAVVDGASVAAVYRKTHLWASERDIFQAGSEPAPVLDTRVGRVGVGVCYDLFFPEVTRGLALGGADIIAVPTNSPSASAKAQPRDNIGVSIARAAAHVNRVYIAVCDRYGEERGQRWVGRSAIVDPDGELVAGPPGDRETTLLAECDLASARDKRWTGTDNDALGDRRPELYQRELFRSVGGLVDGLEHNEQMGVG
ncbi:MAG TPA: nitrilase-related carbon-nitrogen hydrolase [Baekduia sp.]|nr:nitrilase-related carbon-nitrogen hydrolase [Baekduia sp.]